ncbi:MAG: hypothetical protein P4M11_13740 [Candidatus Pacebacteria bacterium]|nr:hypothetical protein [Candidatus Paceibacterota bacterium]
MATTEDFKLLVFGLNLFLLRTIQMKIRLVHFLHFLEPSSQLIVAGIDGCFLIDFEYESRYKSKQALVLDPEGKYVKISAEKYVMLGGENAGIDAVRRVPAVGEGAESGGRHRSVLDGHTDRAAQHRRETAPPLQGHAGRERSHQ